MHSSFKRKIQQYVASWEKKGYANGIPDEAPETLERSGRVPSYRLICLAIMRNDHTAQLLGYSRPKCEIYNQLKRVELQARETANVKQGKSNVPVVYAGLSKRVAEEIAAQLRTAGVTSAFACTVDGWHETRVNPGQAAEARAILANIAKRKNARYAATQLRFDF